MKFFLDIINIINFCITLVLYFFKRENLLNKRSKWNERDANSNFGWDNIFCNKFLIVF